MTVGILELSGVIMTIDEVKENSIIRIRLPFWRDGAYVRLYSNTHRVLCPEHPEGYSSAAHVFNFNHTGEVLSVHVLGLRDYYVGKWVLYDGILSEHDCDENTRFVDAGITFIRKGILSHKPPVCQYCSPHHPGMIQMNYIARDCAIDIMKTYTPEMIYSDVNRVWIGCPRCNRSAYLRGKMAIEMLMYDRPMMGNCHLTMETFNDKRQYSRSR